MAFKRISLRGFEKSYTVRCQVEGFGEIYICTASLYEGHHLRRKTDEISSHIPTMSGVDAANELADAFREQLIERHGLAKSLEAARR